VNCFQKLKNRNYEAAFDTLEKADQNRKPPPYLKDDLERPELIKRTIEAVKKQAEKRARELQEKHGDS
jgi:hypothetical protein